jgi:type IV secretion system protein VirB10
VAPASATTTQNTAVPDLTSLGLALQASTPTAQERQQAFLNAPVDRRTVAADRVAAPASPTSCRPAR